MSVSFINPYRFPPASSYLVEENFETGSAPSGWTISGAWTWNNTSPVMQGTYTPKSQDFATPSAYIGFTAQGEVFCYTLYQTANAGSAGGIHQFRDTGNNNICTISYLATGVVRVLWADFSANVSTVGTMSSNTTYHVWTRYKKGTGANAIASVGFSTDGTRPTSGNNYAELTAGAYTVDCDRVLMVGANDNVARYFDRYLISSSVIGNSP